MTRLLEHINSFGLTETEATILKYMLLKKVVPFIKGKPGIGKSAIIHSIAKKCGLGLSIISLSTCDETDLGVMPKIASYGDHYAAHPVLPLWAIKANENINGHIVLFEELNRARTEITNAALGILNERVVGHDFYLKDHVLMVANGNLGDADGNEVTEFDTATNGRLIEIPFNLTFNQWKDGFAEGVIIPLLLQYLSLHLSEFSPLVNLNEKVQVNPRRWTQFSEAVQVFSGKQDPSKEDLKAACHKIGNSFLGNHTLKLLRWVSESDILTLDDILTQKVKDFKAISRDNKSMIMKEFESYDLEEMKPKQIKIWIDFLKACDQDEVSGHLHYLTQNYTISDSENLSKIIQSFQTLVEKIIS